MPVLLVSSVVESSIAARVQEVEAGWLDPLHAFG